MMVGLGLALFALCACGRSNEPPAVLLAKARQLLSDNRPAEALAAVGQVLKTDPRNPDVYLLQGQIAEAGGDLNAALKAYARADAMGSQDQQARYKVVDLLLEANQLDAAAERVHALLGDRPDDIVARAYRARVEALQGLTVEARVDAVSVLAVEPLNGPASSALATVSLAENNPEAALATVSSALAAQPTDTGLLRLKGQALIARHAPEAAMAVFEGLVRLAPRSARDRVALATLQAEAGKIDAGEQTLRQGLVTTADTIDMHLQLAAFLARYRGPAAATEELRRAIDGAPGTSAFDLALSELLVRSGQATVAVDTLRATVHRLPDGPENRRALIGLARLLFANGDRAGARASLDAVLSQPGTDDEALALRATQKIAAGDGSAVDDLLGVAGRHPASAVPFQLLAQAYFSQGKTEEGLVALRRAADAAPTLVASAVALADAFLRLDRQDDAKGTIARFVDRNPASVEGFVAAIRLAIRQKDWDLVDTDRQRLARLSGGDRAARMLDAEATEAKGAPADAATQFRTLIEQDPPDTFDQRAADGYVRTALASGQSKAAVAALTADAERRSGLAKATATLTLAALHKRLGQDAEALEVAAKAVKLDPGQSAAYLLQAEILAAQRHPEDAIRILTEGVQSGAPGEALLLARAGLERTSGHPDIAIETYEALLRVAPGSLVAANNLGSLVADQRPNDLAKLKAAKALIERMAPAGFGSVLDTLAWIDYRLGNFAAAEQRLGQAGAASARDPQLRYHYGAVLIAMGRKEQGRMLVKSALDDGLVGSARAEALLAP